MNSHHRSGFSTRLGMIFATAGSAVGLGNIWRFPYTTGANGGAAFILLYICFVLFLGLPGMISEFIIGRRSASNAARAYESLTNRKPWRAVGWLGILTSTLILGFYSVIAGWCIGYFFISIKGNIGGNAAEIAERFTTFSSDPVLSILCGCGFILLTHIIVVRGIRGGIERASRLFMPLMFLLLLVIAVASCLLPGSLSGIEFLFRPDFGKVNASVLLEAMGQAFFSLSLGTACLCTYASYFGKNIDLIRAAWQIALIDTIIAILAGLMIFPAAFSVGVSPDSGPSLIFITLPNVFQKAFSNVPVVGYLISLLFYALLSLAAITSTISMHEIGTAFFHEEWNISRHKAAFVVTLLAILICAVCALSVGAMPALKILRMSCLDFFDSLTANILLPVGAFLTSIYVGWCTPKRVVYEELTNGNTLKCKVFRIYLFTIRFLCPTFILLIFLHLMSVI